MYYSMIFLFAVFESQPNYTARQNLFYFVCPFDQDNILRVSDNLVESQERDFTRIFDSVSVNMKNIPELFLFERNSPHEDKRRAQRALPDAETPKKPLYKGGFAAAEFANKANDYRLLLRLAVQNLLCQALSEFFSRG